MFSSENNKACIVVFMRVLAILFLLFSAVSCGNPQTPEDFRAEGLSIVQNLLADLKNIKQDEDFSGYLPKLSVHFEELVSVMIAAHEWMEQHPDVRALPLSREAAELNNALSQELNRLYRLERGRYFIEAAQEKPLQRLDAYLHRIHKAQSRRHAPPSGGQ